MNVAAQQLSGVKAYALSTTSRWQSSMGGRGDKLQVGVGVGSSLAGSEGTSWERWPLRDNQSETLLQPDRAVGKRLKKGSTGYKLALASFFFFSNVHFCFHCQLRRKRRLRVKTWLFSRSGKSEARGIPGRQSHVARVFWSWVVEALLKALKLHISSQPVTLVCSLPRRGI